MADRLAKANERLYLVGGMRQNVIRRFPFARLAEDHDGRAAKLEHGFLIATNESAVEWMLLHNAAHRKRPDLDKAEPSKMRRLEDIHLALIHEIDIRLVEQRLPIHCPEAASKPRMIDRVTVVGIVDVMVVDRRKPRDQHGAPAKRAGAFF